MSSNTEQLLRSLPPSSLLLYVQSLGGRIAENAVYAYGAAYFPKVARDLAGKVTPHIASQHSDYICRKALTLGATKWTEQSMLQLGVDAFMSLGDLIVKENRTLEEQLKEILDSAPDASSNAAQANQTLLARAEASPLVSNHTGYGRGGENFEHDSTGDLMNYSGVVDEVENAQKEHEGWQEGYDY